MTATTLRRARAGYDPEFRRHLAEAVLTIIATESRVSDAAVMAVRTSETMDALADTLIAIMALVPNFDTPSELRKATETLAKRVRHEVPRARAEGVGDILGASRWSGHA